MAQETSPVHLLDLRPTELAVVVNNKVQTRCLREISAVHC